jgi:hypothetical protein
VRERENANLNSVKSTSWIKTALLFQGFMVLFIDFFFFFRLLIQCFFKNERQTTHILMKYVRTIDDVWLLLLKITILRIYTLGKWGASLFFVVISVTQKSYNDCFETEDNIIDKKEIWYLNIVYTIKGKYFFSKVSCFKITYIYILKSHIKDSIFYLHYRIYDLN